MIQRGAAIMKRVLDDVTYAKGWLRALLDGEGHVRVGNGTNNRSRYVEFANTERAVIDDAIRMLAMLGITGVKVYTTPRKPPQKTIMHLRVTNRADVTRFIREVGASIPYKRQSMAAILHWYRREGQPYRTRYYGPKKPSQEQLQSMLERGLSRPQMAQEIGCAIGTLEHYLGFVGLSGPYRNRKDPGPPRDELHQAYIVENLSLADVGKRFGLRRSSLVRMLRRHDLLKTSQSSSRFTNPE